MSNIEPIEKRGSVTFHVKPGRSVHIGEDVRVTVVQHAKGGPRLRGGDAAPHDERALGPHVLRVYGVRLHAHRGGTSHVKRAAPEYTRCCTKLVRPSDERGPHSPDAMRCPKRGVGRNVKGALTCTEHGGAKR